MKALQTIVLGTFALGFAGAASAQSNVAQSQPQVLRDVSGAPVLVYGGPNDMVVAEEAFIAERVIVAKEPAVRDSSGNPVSDGTGRAVKSVSAAPMTEEEIVVYQVDRYFPVPSASAGSSAPSTPSTVAVPGPVDPSSE